MKLPHLFHPKRKFLDEALLNHRLMILCSIRSTKKNINAIRTTIYSCSIGHTQAKSLNRETDQHTIHCSVVHLMKWASLTHVLTVESIHVGLWTVVDIVQEGSKGFFPSQDPMEGKIGE